VVFGEKSRIKRSDSQVVWDNLGQFLPEHCPVFGYTYTDRFIAVAFEILDEDVPIVRPITAFEPSED
jgi:hypothetical protein